jgi:hypothetical protein
LKPGGTGWLEAAARSGSGDVFEGVDLTCWGLRVSGRGERRSFRGRHNSKKKMYYHEYAKAFGPTGSGEGQGGLQRGLAGHRGGLS